jgi:uncharacterized membrane protein
LPTTGTSGFLWKFLFTAVALFQPIDSSHSLLMLYALLPWMGVMFTGYVMGQIYHPDFAPCKTAENIIYRGDIADSFVCCFKGDQHLWRSLAMGGSAQYRVNHCFIF